MDELEISGKRYISTLRAAKEHKYHSDYIGQLIRGKKVAGQKVGRSWYVDADSLAEYLGKESKSASSIQPAEKIEKVTPPPALVVEKDEDEDEEDEEEEEAEEEKVKDEPAPARIEEIVEKEEEPVLVSEAVVEPEIVPEPVPVAVATVAEKQPEEKKTSREELPVAVHQRRHQLVMEGSKIRISGGLRYMNDDEPLFPRENREEKIKISTHAAAPIVEKFYEEKPLEILEQPKKAASEKSNWLAQVGLITALALVTLALAAGSALIVATTTIKGGAANVTYSITGM